MPQPRHLRGVKARSSLRRDWFFSDKRGVCKKRLPKDYVGDAGRRLPIILQKLPTCRGGRSR